MKIISIPILTIFVTGFIITNCQSISKNNLNTQIPSDKTVLKLPVNETASVQKYTNSDFEKFIREANNKISQNAIIFSALKETLNNNIEMPLNDFEILNGIEKKNYFLKTKLDYYVEEGIGNWQTFKAAFDQDLNDLDLSYSEMTIKDNL